MKKVDLIQGTDAWLSWRLKGVGASNTPALFEASPYQTIRDLWFSKSGFDEDELSESKKTLFSIGHSVEEKVRQLYLNKLGVKMTPACYELDDIILASLDGENENEGVLEVKYTGKENVKKAKLGEIPIHHTIQVQQQLLCSGYDKAHYVCTNDGIDYVSVIIRPDLKMQSEIRDKIFKFWEMVEAGKCPELGPKDTFFITDADQRMIFKKFKEIHAQKKAIETEYKALEAQIKDMAKHPKVKCAGVSITSYEVAGSIDYKSIESLKDINLEDYRKKPSLRKRITIGDE